MRSFTWVLKYVTSASRPSRGCATARPRSTVTDRSAFSVGLPTVTFTSPALGRDVTSPADAKGVGATKARPAVACRRACSPIAYCAPMLGLMLVKTRMPGVRSGRSGVASVTSDTWSRRAPAVPCSRPSSSVNASSANRAAVVTDASGAYGAAGVSASLKLRDRSIALV